MSDHNTHDSLRALETASAVQRERQETMGLRVQRVEQKLDVMQTDIHEIKLMMAEVRGGWKLAVRISAVAGAVVGGLSTFLLKLLLDISV